MRRGGLLHRPLGGLSLNGCLGLGFGLLLSLLAGAAFFGGTALGFQLLVALLHDLAGAKQLAASMIPVLEGWKEENLIYEK